MHPMLHSTLQFYNHLCEPEIKPETYNPSSVTVSQSSNDLEVYINIPSPPSLSSGLAQCKGSFTYCNYLILHETHP